MASQELKHRTKENTDTNTKMNTNNTNKMRRQKRMAMAKRGLRSLAIAVSIPLSLTLASIYFFGSSHAYRTVSKPIWFPGPWVLHVTSLASTFLMGLSAWLVWAEGGFRVKPMAMALYLAQLGLSLAWDPVLFSLGATRVGLALCLGVFGALIGCARMFRDVNPIAGDLVKPCLAWAGFLGIVNLKLMYL